MKIKVFILILIFPLICSSQLSDTDLHEIDSIQKVIESADHDTTIIKSWIAWDNIIYYSDVDLDQELNEKIKELSLKNISGQISESERLFYIKSLGTAYNNLGIIAKEEGDHAKAIDYYTKSLKAREEIDDKNGIASTYNNIGNIYFEQYEYTKALDYHTKSLELREEYEDKLGIATSLTNIGLLYKVQGELNLGMDYYNRALSYMEEIGNKFGIAACLSNIGQIHEELGNFENAIEHYTKSLELQEEVGNILGITTPLVNISAIYYKQGNLIKAINYGERALGLAQEVGAVIRIKDASSMLYKCYKDIGNFKSALSMYELFIEARDSILSEANQKEVIRQEYKYVYEKQAAVDSIKNIETQKVKDAEITAQNAQIGKEKTQRYALYGGLLFVLGFLFFVFNRLRLTRKQKDIIERQKEIVEEAHQEIKDSITYAKRIQSAILPPSRIVKEYLNDSFIVYKPKDVVAGDFYWIAKKNGKTLFAAADCTGHGVPGAMVSVVCNNALNRSVREYGILEPGKILDKTREIVISEFQAYRDENLNAAAIVRDGMDIALCSLDGTELLYAGAHNSLWIIRNGDLIETKADKQPIGNFDKAKPFTTHSFNLIANDTLYIFSDGFVDQFGGEKGKKFKPKALRDLLLGIQGLSMEDQKVRINEVFEEWKADFEQVDDVCMIGVRV